MNIPAVCFSVYYPLEYELLIGAGFSHGHLHALLTLAGHMCGTNSAILTLF